MRKTNAYKHINCERIIWTIRILNLFLIWTEPILHTRAKLQKQQKKKTKSNTKWLLIEMKPNVKHVSCSNWYFDELIARRNVFDSILPKEQ